MMNFIKKLFGKTSSEGEATDHVTSFNEEQAKEEDVQFIDHGIKLVPLDRITGSVGKYTDFDSRFRPKRHVFTKRYKEIVRVMREGGSLPPVRLYQIRNDYYVLDGNHRVAAAKELGWNEIRAKVVELLSGRNSMENLIYIEKQKFYEKTGIPEQIELTEVGKYRFLEKQIVKHQVFLASQSGKDCDFQKAAKDWLTTIYLPLTAIISSGGLNKYFPGRTIADLYTYISYHHWERSSQRRYGAGIDQVIPKSMEGFRTAMLEKNTPEYPEMKRNITAFVFIDLNTPIEVEIIDRLYSLEEVQEVHSVHGSIDILLKVVLKRDFLASDAETIAEFVDQNVRRVEGVQRTQTVIPGVSRVKPGFTC